MRALIGIYDPNLVLIDVINDPSSTTTSLELATVSLGVGLDSGYYDAECLADCVSHLWTEIADNVDDDDSDARLALRELLSVGVPYICNLFDTVRHLSPEDASWALHTHTEMMKHRADTYRAIENLVSIAA